MNKITNNLLRELTIKAEDNKEAIIQLASLMPEVAWLASTLNFNLGASERNLRRAILAAREGFVATTELSEVFNATYLSEILPKDTKILGADSLGNNTYHFRFAVKQRSEDTKVYRIQAFPHWENLTGDKYLMVYNGPEYLIHNSTSNCTRAIDKPILSATYENCREPNYHDPKLLMWSPKYTDENPISVAKSTKYSYIYCLFNNITLSSGTTPCPPYPFKISIEEDFETKQHVHHFKEEFRYQQQALVEYKSPEFERTKHDAAFMQQMHMLNHISQLTNQLQEIQNNPLKLIKVNLSSNTLMSALSIIGGIITVGSFAYKCFFRKSGKDKEGITIINSTNNESEHPNHKIIEQDEPLEQNEYENIHLDRIATAH